MNYTRIKNRIIVTLNAADTLMYHCRKNDISEKIESFLILGYIMILIIAFIKIISFFYLDV